MPLCLLSLTDFRNHADALIVPDHMFVVLTGENGAGKTNILEAVSMLEQGRGLRGSLLRDMARQDGPGDFSIADPVCEILVGPGRPIHSAERLPERIERTRATTSNN